MSGLILREKVVRRYDLSICLAYYELSIVRIHLSKNANPSISSPLAMISYCGSGDFLYFPPVSLAFSFSIWYSIVATQINIGFTRKVCVLNGKNARFVPHAFCVDHDLCRSNLSCAFFSAQLRLRTFYSGRSIL